MTEFCWGCCVRVENCSGTREVTNPDVGAEWKASAEQLRNWNTNGCTAVVDAMSAKKVNRWGEWRWRRAWTDYKTFLNLSVITHSGHTSAFSHHDGGWLYWCFQTHICADGNMVHRSCRELLIPYLHRPIYFISVYINVKQIFQWLFGAFCKWTIVPQQPSAQRKHTQST